MNKVELMGRITRDPAYKPEADGKVAIARYTLAVDRRRSRDGAQNADFISCVAYGREADFASKYFHKGIKLVVIGRIQTGSYTNKDGQKVYTTDVIVEDQEFAESKRTAAPDARPGYAAEEDSVSLPDDVDDMSGLGLE